MKAKFILLILFMFVSVFSAANKAQAEVWVAENQWSDEWETKYREWVRTKMHSKFFAQEILKDGTPNPYYGIRVDCADLVYSIRIIFAFENKLPFAMVNPVAPKGGLITNSLKRYDKLPEGVERLKGFLTWVYDLVGTTSLPNDTFSVGFGDVGPGTIILTTKKNHHSWTIRGITKTGNPILIYNSTVEHNLLVGREINLDVQERQSWPNPFWIFEPEVDPLDETKIIPVYVPGSYAGFRYWRPAEYLKMPEAVVPRYSEEQHTIGIGKWKQSAQTLLAKVKETLDQVVMRLLKDACADVKQRVAAVQEAEMFKADLANALASGDPTHPYVQELQTDSTAPADKRCMTYKKFDQYSTPSRDRRLIDALVLARAYYQYGVLQKGESVFSLDNLKIYKAIFPHITKSASEESALDLNSKSAVNFCAVQISPKLGNLSLAEIKRRLFAGKLSSNPNDSSTGRFGYMRTSADLGAECPAYDLNPNPPDLHRAEAEAAREVQISVQAL